MSTLPSDLSLNGDFGQADDVQWRELVDKALKGADFEKRLVSRTQDNIALQPLYQQAPTAQPITTARSGQPWGIAQRIDHPDPEQANSLALQDLENGANQLVVVEPGAVRSAGYGLDISSSEALTQALANVSLDMIGLRVEPRDGGLASSSVVSKFVKASGYGAAKLSVNFGLDPLGCLMRTGTSEADWAGDLASTVSQLRTDGFECPLINCDMRPIHEAGGSETQELAAALAMGVAYLKALSENGLSLDEARSCLSWTVAIDADQFLSIAKLRALRLLWARVEEASGLDQRPIDIHAETAWRMMSRRDPAVNMLRTTMATAAASIGGADSISVLPYTLPLGLPNAFARRVARNTQTILMEESNLWRVADPAAGAGAYEAITDELCAAAWLDFQDIEREGGLAESFKAGGMQERIAKVRQHRDKQIATRKIALTGTSEFPNLAETDESVLEVAPKAATSVAEGERIGDPLPSQRLAEPFEIMRDASDAAATKAGARPAVFLANLGTLADHGGRATWIGNLLAAGGIAAIGNDGFTNSADVGNAFSESGATVACICGTDEAYGELAEAVASLLKTAGAKSVLLAGKPGDAEAELRAAGIDMFLHVGVDVVAALNELHKTLDI
ncbi:MAG: methylmalonyl-CoA mutase family protein [Pseudomonadota bacterium]